MKCKTCFKEMDPEPTVFQCKDCIKRGILYQPHRADGTVATDYVPSALQPANSDAPMPECKPPKEQQFKSFDLISREYVICLDKNVPLNEHDYSIVKDTFGRSLVLCNIMQCREDGEISIEPIRVENMRLLV